MIAASQGLEGRLGSGAHFPIQHLATMALSVDGHVVSNSAADTGNLSNVIGSYQRMWRTEGMHLETRYGKPNVDVAVPGSDDLEKHEPGTIAAYAQLSSGHSVFLGDRRFSQKAGRFAQQYGIDRDLAERYIWLHEIGHSKGRDSEEGAERFVKEYAESRLAEAKTGKERADYENLVKVAEHRMQFGKRLDEMRRKKSATMYSMKQQPATETSDVHPAALERRLNMLASSYGLSSADARDYAQRAASIYSSGVKSAADVAQKLAKAYSVLSTQQQGPMRERYARLAEVARREAVHHKYGSNGYSQGSDESKQRYAVAGSGSGRRYKAKAPQQQQAKAA